jgi:phage shock protein PspC (stress-responsive transcriptional regulator)
MRKFYLQRGTFLGGVCAGLEKYTGLDVIFWRLAFLFTLKWTLLPYFLIWLVAPVEPEVETNA